MLLDIFAVRDSAAGAYLNPFALPNTPTALRAFKSCVDDPGHQFHVAPGDYSLFSIGQFDTTTGIIQGHTQPVLISQAQDFIKAKTTVEGN